MNSIKRELGNYGEQLAIKFLKNHGYQILATNFRSNKNEIDIIIKDDQEIVFIEVKTRSSITQELPEYAVNYHKLQNIINTAQQWMMDNDYQGYWRIDTISIVIDFYQKTAHLKWFKNSGEKN